MSEHDSELPAGWTQTEIRNIAAVNPPGSLTVLQDHDEVTFIPMAAVEVLSGKIDVSLRRPFGDVKKGFTRFWNRDLLFARITPCMENGKLAVARDLHGGIGCGSTEFHVIRPEDGINEDFLRFWMLRSAYRQDAERNMQGTVGQRRVPADYVRSSKIPVAPSNEQKRIVSKIDELFSEIEAGERALERVRKLIERYRQSILKAAVTGELTRAWREKHKGVLASREALLARILKGRRDEWEAAELEKMRAKGQKPENDVWKRRYKDPPQPLIGEELSTLPDGWLWASIDQICHTVTDGEHITPPRTLSGVLLLSARNVRDGISICSRSITSLKKLIKNCRNGSASVREMYCFLALDRSEGRASRHRIYPSAS